MIGFWSGPFFGALKNGTQKFASEPPQMIMVLMLLAFAALVVPTLTHYLHTKADSHINTLNVLVAIVLLLIFGASLTFTIKGDKVMVPEK